MTDIRLTGIQLRDFSGVNVKSKDWKVFLAKAEDQGQADVAESDYSNVRAVRSNFVE